MTANRNSIGVICWALVLLLATPAEARRIALVIGNADYKVGALQNPVGDAAAVAEAFEKQLGFDKVILRKNLTFNGFRLALNELSRMAAGADIAVVYFAGHGMEVGGKNFLIPVDAMLGRASALELEAITLETVLAQLEGVRELKLVILDACRNNPFVVRGGKRSIGRGLARIEPDETTLVVYAAKDGTTADDGIGRPHSPFTEALLKHIAAPETEVRILFGRIGEEVAAATGRQQQPYQYGTLGSKELYLLPRKPSPPAPKADSLPKGDALSPVERAWAEVKGSSSIAALEAFRRLYGPANALYDQLAAERLAALNVRPSKGASSEAPDSGLPMAPGSPMAPSSPVAPPVSTVAPVSPVAPVAPVYPKPPTTLAKPIIPVAPISPTPPTTAVKPSVAVPPDLARLIQTELKRVGCDPGPIDGAWGDKAEEALQRFTRFAKVALRTDRPTVAALDAVKEERGRICPLECGTDTVERGGVCVPMVAPPSATPPKAAPRPRVKRIYAPRNVAPRREKPKRRQGLCWAIERTTNSLVPCSDPRAGPKAF